MKNAKKILAILLALVLVLSMAACSKKDDTTKSGDNGTTNNGGSTTTDNGGSTNNNTTNNGGSGEVKYEFDIKVWVPEKDAEKDLTKSMIEEFNKTNTDGIKLNATIESVSEADAATQMITDVEAGADMFNFAQDQLSRLIMAGAVSPLGEGAAAFVRENNVESGVQAVAAGDALYGYPITVDNGYYLFYDKSVVSDEEAKTVDGILAACERSGRTFAAPIGGNGWYLAGWFFGTGCDSTWVTDDDGNFVSINDTFNSDNGLIAAKGLYQIISNKWWVDSDQASEFQAAIPCCAFVSGPWNNTTIHDILGDNMGAAKMPTYSVDGKTYQIGSFSGSKIIGVKPQTDKAKAACLSKLAQYLSGEECQKKRFEALEWGPSNKNLATSDAVLANPGLAALAAQAPFAKPQGNVHGSWWDISKAIGAGIKDSDGSDASLKAILQKYYDDCNAVFNMTSDEKEAFSVIGAICGTAWDADFAMTRTAESGPATYYSEALELHAGDEFKIRQGASWDVNFGSDGEINGPNCVVDADGYYFVKLVTNEDNTHGDITLEKTSYHSWAVIGAICGTAWDTDFEMSIQADGKTYKLEGVELKANDEFKVRLGHNWDNNYGAGGVAGGDNFKVEADGTYTIVFDSETGMITLE